MMPESAITMPGIADHHPGTGDHDGLEWVITFDWNARSRWAGLRTKHTRDPVAPAKRSSAALDKVYAKVLDDGTPVHSFQTLLTDLSSIVSNACRRPGPSLALAGEATFDVVTTPNSTQQRAYDLLKSIHV